VIAVSATSTSPRLLLLSNSMQHGLDYLAHAEPAIHEHLHGIHRLTFVPFALADHEGYAAKVRERFETWGIAVDGLQNAHDMREAIEAAQAVFVGGGNSFRLLRGLQEHGLVAPLRARVMAGMPYMGASAGTNLACPTIRTTNDMPIVEPRSFEALGLIPFQINPHYLDPDPRSRHMGETRETRLREYLEENPGPVLGLREGSWLVRRGERLTLEGARPARLFVAKTDPREIESPADLSFLLP
jgi:dipeptidase E